MERLKIILVSAIMVSVSFFVATSAGADLGTGGADGDPDCDGVPTWWEQMWGYDPLEWDDHANLDPDNDGLDNVEEYLTSGWDSDPFGQDIFLELAQMEPGPNGEGAVVPELSKDMLRNAYGRHNIAFHIVDTVIPFDGATTMAELHEFYLKYFLENDTNSWKRGVFHYGIMPYHCTVYAGFAFSTTVDGENYSLDSFQVSVMNRENALLKNPIYWLMRCKTLSGERSRATAYAGVIMHEMGHNLGIFHSNSPGCDNVDSIILQKEWLKWRNYRSCMNYDRVYNLVDYSDGSHGKNDFDDWGFIDLTFFQNEFSWH